MTHALQNEANRTATADGKAIQRLRQELGWNRATLAIASDCAVRTIRNAEKGKPLFLSTIRNIASSLGVKVSQILPKTTDGSLFSDQDDVPLVNLTLAESAEGEAIERSGHDPDTFRIAISFCLEGDYEVFATKHAALSEFMASVTQLIEACHQLTPLRVTKGSIIITVEMAASDVRNLAKAFRAGSLDQLGVTDIVNQSLLDWLYSSEGRAYMEATERPSLLAILRAQNEGPGRGR